MTGVCVVGSVSADVTAFADRLPSPGETVLGTGLSLVLGGKGANQAVAAARFGAPTWLVGCVGEDVFADLCRDGLGEHGVRTDRLAAVAGPTGVAHIRVDRTGQNDIVVAPLANAELTEDVVTEALAGLAGTVSVLLLQLEIRAEVTVHAARLGHEAGLTVVLDPAPAAELPAELWPYVDLVTPNESEAALLTGVEVTGADGAAEAGRWFLDRGVREAVVTLGDRGAVHVDADGVRTRDAYPVEVVDTTAAGDAFTGTLGAALAAGTGRDRSLAYALAAGSLAVTRRGASPSLPDRTAVLGLADGRTDPGQQ